VDNVVTSRRHVPDRRRRAVPELVERDLDMVPTIVLGAVLALFDQLEGYRPLLDEELSTRVVVQTVRDGRNQLIEERFGSGGGVRSQPHQGQEPF